MNQLLELVYAFADEVLDANRPDVYNLLVNLVVLAKTESKEYVETEYARIRRLYNKTRNNLRNTVDTDVDQVTQAYKSEYYKTC